MRDEEAQAAEDKARRKDKIAARIRALRAKTVENGCTEGEALAAAELAAKLLEAHDLSMDEVEMRASPFASADQDHAADEVGQRFWRVADAIAALTGTRSWVSPSGVSPIRHTFFGFAHEVEIANYLLEICSRAVRSECAVQAREWAFYRPSVRRARRTAFLDGMCDRLASRIRAMRKPQPTGTGLVVLRGALIDEEMARRHIELETNRMRPPRDLDPSYVLGLAAGDAVALDPGIAPPKRPVGTIADGTT